MKRYLSMLGACLKIALSNATAYRANFVMSMLIVFFSNVLFPLVTILIYGSGAGFPGWSFHQVLLIQAVFTVSAGISGIFFNGLFWATNFHIREGTFEIALLKPADTIFYLVVSSIQLENGGMIIGGLVMAGIALASIGMPVAGAVFAGLALFAGGVAVMLGITLVMAATSFKWIGNSRIPEMFDSVLQFAKYPLDIFPPAARAAASFVLPVAMIGFFPANALLGQARPEYFLLLVPCVLFLLIGIALYNKMIRNYEGVGG